MFVPLLCLWAGSSRAALNGNTSKRSGTSTVAGITSAPNRTDAVASADPQPTFALTNTVNRRRVSQGEQVTFTLSLTNTSPYSATSVAITNVFSQSGLTLISQASSGTFTPDASGGTWTLGNVDADQTASLTLTTTINAPGILRSVATAPDGQQGIACVTVPVQVCAGDVFEFELSAPGTFSSYQWNHNGHPIAGATAATLSATAVGEYTVATTNQTGCPDGSCCPFVIEETPVPSLSVVAQSARCVGVLSQNDALLSLVSSSAVSYNIAPGSSFTATTPLFSAPRPLSAVVNGALVANLPNPATPAAYTVRVFAASGCFSDVVVTVQPAACACPLPRCAPLAMRKTKSEGRAL